MNEIERRRQRPQRKPPAHLDTNPVRALVEVAAELERKVATVNQLWRTDMQIRERRAEAEIAQARLDREQQ